jgi:hypothetical protein
MVTELSVRPPLRVRFPFSSNPIVFPSVYFYIFLFCLRADPNPTSDSQNMRAMQGPDDRWGKAKGKTVYNYG